MNDLLKAKQEAYENYLHHQQLAQKHERLAQKARYEMLDINDEIRAVERKLAEPIKIIYGEV